MTSELNESGLTLLQKIQFYIGNGGRNIISGLVNVAFVKYYTDYIGLDPKWMGYVYIFFTVWAALNDPIFGLWADKRPFKKGFGKYRPIFIGSLPFLVAITIAFPWANPSWSQLGISIYLFAALTLWETASTLIGLSYGAIATNMFLTTAERAEVEVIDNYLGVLSIFGNTIPIMILSMDVSNQTMRIFFGIVTIIAGLIIAISIPVMRESEEFYKHDQIGNMTFKDFLGEMINLLSEKAFLFFFLTFLLFQRVASNYLLGLSYFYDNVVLSKGVWTGLPDILIGIMGLMIFPLAAKWIRKYGTKLVVSRMIVVSIVGYVLLAFVPATEGDALNMFSIFGFEVPGEKSYWLATLSYFVVYFGFCAIYTANGPIKKRLIDYLEIQTGKRRPGMIGGALGVLMTPGTAIYVFLYTQIISAFGYDGASKIQSASSQLGIRLATGLLPAAMIVLGLYFFSKYPIDKETEDWVEAEMLKKHRSGETKIEDEPQPQTS
ncbi:MAG: MFS transporter [Anaerolineae bacterium]|nr:MFS transporter [Anaerolineae bacterium]